MSLLQDLMQATLAATPEQQEAALRILRGEPPRSEPYLTLAELGRRVGFSTKSLRRWRVPSHNFGGSPRYLESEVLAYFQTETFQRRQAALRAERKQERFTGKAGTMTHKDSRNHRESEKPKVIPPTT